MKQLIAPIQIVQISNGYLVSQQGSEGNNPSMTYCEDSRAVMNQVRNLVPQETPVVIKP